MDLFRTQTLESLPDEEQIVFRRFELTVVAGPDQGATGQYGQESVQVGTARAADLTLTDPTVSRFHIKVETREGSFVVSDLASTNGTYLGGHRIRVVDLDNETVLELGSTKIRFLPLSDEATISVPVRDRMGPLIGKTTKMRQLYSLLERVASTDLPVIIEGETGTGKDLVARMLHSQGPRAKSAYEVLDCGSVPETLIQSELFGHVKGAFTGADRDRAGIFERASGGTVFLDELGELAIDLQPKLLRVLENSEIRRVGANDPLKVDVRVVCATHRSLRTLVNKGEFREDLYYRLAGCKIDMPPLRDRRADIPLLIEHFLDELRLAGHDSAPDRLSPETTRVFKTRMWPGNIRQLRNAVKRVAVIGYDDFAITEMSEETTDVSSGPRLLPIKDAREHFERGYLTDLMSRFPANLQGAADASKMHPKSLARLLRKHGLDKSGDES